MVVQPPVRPGRAISAVAFDGTDVCRLNELPSLCQETTTSPLTVGKTPLRPCQVDRLWCERIRSKPGRLAREAGPAPSARADYGPLRWSPTSGMLDHTLGPK